MPKALVTVLAIGVATLVFELLRRHLPAVVGPRLEARSPPDLEFIGGLYQCITQQTVAHVPPERLASVARYIAQRLGLSFLAIEIDDEQRAKHGEEPDSVDSVDVLPLVHRNQEVGRLRIAPRPSHEHRRLLRQVVRILSETAYCIREAKSEHDKEGA